MKSLKILIYDTNYIKGISRMIPLLKIAYWQKKGCNITIVCTKEGEEFYKEKLKSIQFITIDYTYRIEGAWSVPIEMIKATLFTLTKLKKMIGHFDVVYSQSAVIDFLFIPWLLTFFDRRVRWVVMVDNLVPPPHKRPGSLLKNLIPYLAFLFGNILLRRAHGIFVVTDYLKNFYQSRGYKVIKTNDGYGIEIELFRGPIDNTTPRFDALYTGRLHQAKGVFDLIEVIREIVKKKKNFTLGIMGDGEEIIKNKLLDKIKEYGLKKHIVFTGYVAGRRKGDILRNCGFFLFLSYDEGCPHAVIEALAVNKQVLAYNLPIYHSIFRKYIKKNQMTLFNQKEYHTIVDYILSLPKKPPLFHNQLKDYTWDNIVMNELRVMKKSIE